ncbi:hypothetical protein VTK73DRAFT_6350 [Phialemonium thermophilum]|uniref:NmrA-like domain-containing protein n=1 Tax=Phialemonium thermophilum TaxID=223376 RepID=A0ABR3WK50_9PEZI
MATYLVTQATGSQSQWVIKHLLNDGAKVHAVVRDLSKVPPLLKDPRITLFQGESQNVDEIFAAAQGCQGVFLNTFPVPGLETAQAQGIVDAAKKAGLRHVVASTVCLADKPAYWDNALGDKSQLRDYYRSKAAVEDIVRRSGLEAYTIIRPAVLQQDYMVPHSYMNFPELPTKGELAHCLVDGARVPHTDNYDAGKFAAAALQDPTRFAGQEIDIVNEALTIEEVRDAIVKASGRKVRVRRRSPEEVEKTLQTVFGQRFHIIANEKDFGAPEFAAAARATQSKFGIPFTSLEGTLQRERAHLLESIPA